MGPCIPLRQSNISNSWNPVVLMEEVFLTFPIVLKDKVDKEISHLPDTGHYLLQCIH